MKCFACGHEGLETKLVEVKTRVGDSVVVDKRNRAAVCGECGEFSLSQEQHESVELHAAITVLDELPITGASLRFSRKALHLKQTDLAAKIGYDAVTISRWECGKQTLDSLSVQGAILGLLRGRLMPLPDGLRLERTG